MNFDYKVIRSKRKTVSVSVSSDNAITVKCPFGLSDSAVDDFIDSKSEWLYRVIAENNVKNSIIKEKFIFSCKLFKIPHIKFHTKSLFSETSEFKKEKI